MSTAVTPVPAIDAVGSTTWAPAGDIDRPAAPSVGEAAPDLRLVIEEDAATGAIIYKTLDRLTGEVVRQLPREEVLRLKADRTCGVGEVFDGQA